jgi:anti-sigma factor (TIGR02949 family)
MSDPLKIIRCDEVIARLWEFIDGQLTPESEATVRSHLDACSNCFPQYDFQRAYVAFVRRTRCGEIPPALRRKVFEMILEEEGKKY